MRTLRRSTPESWRTRTRLLVPAAEVETYAAAWPGYTIWASYAEGIAAVRQEALERADDDKIVLLDDDLWFYVRRQYDPPRLRDAEPADLEALWAATEHCLSPDLPQIGVSFRQHNDGTLPAYTYNGRADRAFALHRPTLARLGITFGVHLMENFHVTLSLLRAGYPNMIWWHWASGQPASNMPGGCS